MSAERLRRATVQVCDPDERIVGTGFVISSDPWLVMTCEHVLEQAGVEVAEGVEVLVRFPEERPPLVRRAAVSGQPAPYEDDVVLLELEPPGAPIMPEHVLVLETAGEADGHRFVSYGFRELGQYEGGIAAGHIQGRLPVPPGLDLACEPLQIVSRQIDGGMSGAPLFDSVTDRVVGIVSEAYYARDGFGKDDETAWAIDGRILEFFPGRIRPDAGDPSALAPPRIGSALAPTATHLGWNLRLAPSAPAPFVGREEVLDWLDAHWRSGRQAVTSVHGPAKSGKTAAVRHWVDLLHDREDRPEGLFWWSFGQVEDVDEFFEAALGFYSGSQVTPAMARGPARVLLLAGYATEYRSVLVLDAVDAVDPRGAREIDELVEFLAGRPDGRSLCVVTSRRPPDDRDAPLDDFELGGVGLEEERALLSIGAGAALDVRPRIEEMPVAWRHLLAALALMRRPLPRAWTGSLREALTTTLDDRAVEVDRVLGELIEAGLVESFGEEPVALGVPEAIVPAAIAAAAPVADLHRALARMWWEHRYLNPHTGEDEWRPAASLDELRPAIEAVHHLCEAGRYEEAWERMWEGVYRGSSYALVNQLGEWGADLELVRHFFPDGDLGAEPVLEEAKIRSVLLNEVGLDLRTLGAPRESLAFFDRAAEVGREAGIGHLSTTTQCRKAETLLGIGDLHGATVVAEAAVARAEEDGDEGSSWYAHATLALPVALRGDLARALEHYDRAREIRAPSLIVGPRALEDLTVRWWAGETKSLDERWLEGWTLADWEKDRESIAGYFRLRGEIEVAAGSARALEAFGNAFEWLSLLVAPQPQIEALTAYASAIGVLEEDPEVLRTAREMLGEALRLIDSTGWSVFEPRTRVAFAHLALRLGEEDSFERHLERARTLAEQSGNAWDLALAVRLAEERQADRYPLAPVELGGALGGAAVPG